MGLSYLNQSRYVACVMSVMIKTFKVGLLLRVPYFFSVVLFRGHFYSHILHSLEKKVMMLAIIHPFQVKQAYK